MNGSCNNNYIDSHSEYYHVIGRDMLHVNNDIIYEMSRDVIICIMSSEEKPHGVEFCMISLIPSSTQVLAMIVNLQH